MKKILEAIWNASPTEVLNVVITIGISIIVLYIVLVLIVYIVNKVWLRR